MAPLSANLALTDFGGDEKVLSIENKNNVYNSINTTETQHLATGRKHKAESSKYLCRKGVFVTQNSSSCLAL